MRCLVTYDIDQPHHAKVKAQCLGAGFRDYVEMPDGSNKQLPNTTLTVRAEDAEDAVKKFKEQVSLVSSGSLMSPKVTIWRVVGVEYTGYFVENDNSPRNALAEALRQYHG
jgi:hypothetical protein